MEFKLELEKVARGLGFPEGPVAMLDGSLLYVDIKLKTLSRIKADSKPDDDPEVLYQLEGGPNGLAIGPDNAVYICNNGGAYDFAPFGPDPWGNKSITVPSEERTNYQGGSIQRYDLKTGEVTTLFTEYKKDETSKPKKLLAPDDIVFDKKRGGFWFTETGIQYPDELKLGALYFATIDGNTLRKVAQIPMANGVALSPDGDTVYVSDTIFGRLWAMDLTPEGDVKRDGLLPTMPGRCIQTLPGYQWLDSLKVEANGNICVGTIFNGGITVFTPDGKTDHYAVPDLFTTNLCFGGADMQDVWITASSTGTIYKGRWERPGLKLAYYR